MRTVEQFITDLDIFKGYLENSFSQDILTEATMDMTAKIIGRVQQTGKLANGTSRVYSKWWAEERTKKGLQTAYKDYFYTGEMWRNTGLVPSKTTKQKVFIGAKTAEAQYKLNENTRIDKMNILLPNEKEVEEAALYIRKELIRFMNEKLAKNV